MMTFGAILAALGGSLGAAPALIHGSSVTDWQTLDRRTNALAHAFMAAGAAPGDKVAHLMRNSPAYLTTTVAAFKARMTHVNVNYRYTGEELRYILDNSDAAVVVYDEEFAAILDSLRAHLPHVKLWLQVGGTAPAWAEDFSSVADRPMPAFKADHALEDQLFIYTGGTTGMPKGVVWEQAALFTLLGGGAPFPGETPPRSLADHVEKVQAADSRRKLLVLPPLMHGTGLLMGIYALALGGCVITSASRSFDAEEALALAEAHAPDIAVIVGDAFARPILRALEAGKGSLGRLRLMISSGTMWSPEIKAGLLAHAPGMICLDTYGSSEGLGYGSSMSTAAAPDAPTRFLHDPNTLVLDDEYKPIPPGSGLMGRVARTGLVPLGYYKDAEKTAKTFITVDGKRFTMPGDWATIEADGAIILLGRGSQCINSGGEKIFPEEVEEALKTHPAVEDALVFGTADEKWGQAVTAVVEATDEVPEADLIAHVRTQLAAYKSPKTVTRLQRVPRAPNGKADYEEAKRLHALALSR